MRPECASAINLRALSHCVLHIQRAFANGNEVGARAALAKLAGEITPALPLLDDMVAKALAGEAFDRTQSTLAAFLVRQPGPDPHAVNDHHLAAPSEPEPILG